MATRERWHEEQQSAWIYERLAEAEGDQRLLGLFRSLAEAARKQAAILEGDLVREGSAAPAFAPSLRARVVAVLARRYGLRRTRTMLAALVQHQKPRDIQLALFDPKYHGLAPFANTPHLLFDIVDDPEQMVIRMNYLVGEMERRDREQITRPRIVIAIDELADILQTGGAQVEALLTRLVQRGRSAGISLIACTQKPTARAVGSLMKANFPVRIVGRVASGEDARVASGISGSGAEKLTGRGDFLLIAGGQVIRFQAAQVRAEEIAQGTEISARSREGGWNGTLRRVK